MESWSICYAHRMKKESARYLSQQEFVMCVRTYALVLGEVGADQVLVDDNASIVDNGGHAPDQEGKLGRVVEWEPEEDQVYSSPVPGQNQSMSHHGCYCFRRNTTTIPEKYSEKVNTEYTTQYVSHWVSSLLSSDSIACVSSRNESQRTEGQKQTRSCYTLNER